MRRDKKRRGKGKKTKISHSHLILCCNDSVTAATAPPTTSKSKWKKKMNKRRKMESHFNNGNRTSDDGRWLNAVNRISHSSDQHAYIQILLGVWVWLWYEFDVCADIDMLFIIRIFTKAYNRTIVYVSACVYVTHLFSDFHLICVHVSCIHTHTLYNSNKMRIRIEQMLISRIQMRDISVFYYQEYQQQP